MLKLAFVIITALSYLPLQARLCSFSFMQGGLSEKSITKAFSASAKYMSLKQVDSSLSFLSYLHKKTKLNGEMVIDNYAYTLEAEKRLGKIHRILKRAQKNQKISYYEVERLAYLLTPKNDPVSGFFRATFGLNLNKENKPLLAYRLEQLALNQKLLALFEKENWIKKDSAWERFKTGTKVVKPLTKTGIATSLYFVGINQIGGIPLWIPSLNFLNNRKYSTELVELYKKEGIDKAYDKFQRDYKVSDKAQKFGLLPEKGLTYILIAIILGSIGYGFLFGSDEDEEFLEELDNIAKKYPDFEEQYNRVFHEMFADNLDTRDKVLSNETSAKAFGAYERFLINKEHHPVNFKNPEHVSNWKAYFKKIHYEQTLRTLMDISLESIEDEQIRLSIDKQSPEAMKYYDQLLQDAYKKENPDDLAG